MVGVKPTNGDVLSSPPDVVFPSPAVELAIDANLTNSGAASPDRRSVHSPGHHFMNGIIKSPTDLAGRKRKRPGSRSVASSTSLSDREQISKRNSPKSDDEEGEIGKQEGLAVGEIAMADEDVSDVLSDVSSQSELTATVEDILPPHDDTLLVEPAGMKDEISDSSSDEQGSDPGLAETAQIENIVLKPGSEIEVDEAAELEADEDEGEAAVKSEDERE